MLKINAFKFCFSRNVQLSGLLNIGFYSISVSLHLALGFTQVLKILEGFLHFGECHVKGLESGF